MEIRKYRSSDIKEIAELFYETVHTINKKDYSEEQLSVWATGNIDMEKWDISFQSNQTFVALENDVIVGFGDIEATGYLDRLYVHKDFQGKGIATAICNVLEKEVNMDCIQAHASITAKPFFIKRGYKVIKEQEVERQGILLTNYLMEKCLQPMINQRHHLITVL
ncbi:GNAT family N-acetyltransferase [Sphingobacterium tabacisoli]|uniref:GNAT family N-acetyltransferase n=1 Tax=Sphingobacterium tabacisoli TaxID=2044855 RepID=A0ABW5L287_9SPHI|nr:GNAT family N-acetyltransferase [Sphingobacterium tabacisoli]